VLSASALLHNLHAQTQTHYIKRAASSHTINT